MFTSFSAALTGLAASEVGVDVVGIDGPFEPVEGAEFGVVRCQLQADSRVRLLEEREYAVLALEELPAQFSEGAGGVGWDASRAGPRVATNPRTAA